MTRLQEAQRKLGVPVTVSKKFMDRGVELQHQIDILTAKNKAYDKTAKLKTEKKYSCDNGTGSYGITISFSDPVIFSRTIVKSPDRLAAL